MKNWSKYYFISCLFLLLILPGFFPGPAAADDAAATPEAVLRNCLAGCQSRQQACLNMNPDRRLCAATYQDCAGACRAGGASAPAAGSDAGLPQVRTDVPR